MKHTRDFLFTNISSDYPEETNTVSENQIKTLPEINTTEESSVLLTYQLHISISYQ